MKSKINKQTLLQEGKSKGFVWLTRYSSDENTDKMGRWARIGYYNGFMISWINGYLIKNGKVENMREVGKCNLFTAHLLFPCSSNQGGNIEKFDTIEDAKNYSEEMFNDFKKLINK
jgi:hypothetical protein